MLEVRLISILYVAWQHLVQVQPPILLRAFTSHIVVGHNKELDHIQVDNICLFRQSSVSLIDSQS